MGFLYLLVAIFATTLGAMSGFGGGIIIKPVLDAFSDYNVFVIGVLSSFTVLCMAFVSTVQRFLIGFKIEKKLVFITIGALLGGVLGKELFGLLYVAMLPDSVRLIQASALIILLVFVLFKNTLPKCNIENPAIIILSGIILGAISSFLGIGGGPFNIVVLGMLFNMDIKQATIASIFLILFSQASNLIAIAFTTTFQAFDYSMLYYMIPGGIVGGFIGSVIGRKLSNKSIERIYFLIIIGLLILNVYNIIMIFL